MLKTELPYGLQSNGKRIKPSDRRVICECNICHTEFEIFYRDYLKKYEKYKETPCKSCLTIERQRGKTLEEQWGADAAKRAKAKSSKTLMGRKCVGRLSRTWSKDQIDHLKKVRPNTGSYEERYGIERSQEIKEKIASKLRGEKSYRYGKPPAQGSGNGWSGWYKGWFFRSILELSYVINELEQKNQNFESAESDKYKIPYRDWNEVPRNYFPDFCVDNKYLIEIKPYSLRASKDVLLKASAAEAWCKTAGYEYKLVFDKSFTRLKREEIISLREANTIKFTDRYEKKYQEYLLEV